MTHPCALAVPAVRSLAPYVPGKPISELERELGLADIVKLASNENPLGPSPRAQAAATRALAEVGQYPDGSAHALRHALARRLDLDPACLTIGNGSNDVLVLLAEAFLGPGLEAVYSQYCFAVYPIAVQATGAHGVVVPAHAADHAMPLGHDLDAMRRAITPRTRLVFVANPNNPTGTWARADAVQAFVASVPRDVLVVLDEAYLEYSRGEGVQDAARWLARYPNLVVVRTFSKAYGLAGLRIGYAASHAEVADALNRVRQPFNASHVALAAAEAALGDEEHLARSVQLALDGRRALSNGLAALGIRALPSAGNFLLAYVGEGAAALDAFLLRAGLIVRPVANYGLGEYLRVSTGLPAQHARLLEAVRRWRDSRG